MAGYGAAHKLREAGAKGILFDKKLHYGGHTASFGFEGKYTFDEGPHVSFTKHERLQKLFAESIESLDMAAVDAVRATGAGEAQVFFHGVWPSVLPQFVSHHLYVWEFNIRDSTILGLIGAGGLGLLISEAVSLFQWSRLATLLIVVVALVMAFDALSRRSREKLL